MQNQSFQAHKVYFEVTNYCNFRCDFCPQAESRRASRHMDWALFAKGIDEVARDRVADTVGFHVLGEPLLYPKILEALAYARSRGLRTEMNTNGSLLTPERVNGLIEAGLGALCVSVQVFDAQAHACRGTALPYEKYTRRVMDAVRLIHASGGEMQMVLCAMDTSTRRYFDIDKVMRVNGRHSAFGANLARFILDLYATVNTPMSSEQVAAAVRKLNLAVPQFVRLTDRLQVYAQPLADWGNAFTARRVHPARVGACGYALKNVGVLSNGEVTICCADYDGHTSLGNLRSNPLAAMLASDQAEAIRAGFRQNRIVHPYCQRCIGSPNLLKAWFKGLMSIYLFKGLGFEPARVKRVPLFQA